MSAFLAYINESIEELRHVRWPTRQQAVRFSAVVLGFTAVCAAFFGAVDLGLSEVLKLALTFAE